jgi:hypothetical protein
MPPLPECKGRGFTYVVGDDYMTRPCPNILDREFRAHIIACASDKATALIDAEPVSASPLLMPTDRTKDNLYITGCTEAVALAHLHFVLRKKGSLYPFISVSDQKILRVFVGDDSSKSRGVPASSPGIYNNVEDLLLDPKLAIIWVGVMSYKNKAGAGALLEGLSMRRHASKPTWIIHVLGTKWEYTYSTEVQMHLDTNFEEVSLGSTVADPDPFIEGTEDHQVAPLQSSQPKPRKPPPEPEPEPESPVEDVSLDDMSGPGEGKNEKKKKYRKGGF